MHLLNRSRLESHTTYILYPRQMLNTAMHLITIITPCYNAAQALPFTLASITCQTYPHIEHLIIDGASQDHTLQVIRQARHPVRFISEPDKGIYDAINKGIKMASGDFIIVMNADDAFYAPQSIAWLYDAWLKARQKLRRSDIVVHGDVMFKINRYDDQLLHRQTIHRMRFGLIFCHQAVMIPRVLHETYGFYHQRYPIGADFEFLLRLKKAGVPLVHVPRPICIFTGGGVSSNHWKTTLDYLRIYMQHYGVLGFLVWVKKENWDHRLIWLRLAIPRSIRTPLIRLLKKMLMNTSHTKHRLPKHLE